MFIFTWCEEKHTGDSAGHWDRTHKVKALKITNTPSIKCPPTLLLTYAVSRLKGMKSKIWKRHKLLNGSSVYFNRITMICGFVHRGKVNQQKKDWFANGWDGESVVKILYPLFLSSNNSYLIKVGTSSMFWTGWCVSGKLTSCHSLPTNPADNHFVNKLLLFPCATFRCEGAVKGLCILKVNLLAQEVSFDHVAKQMCCWSK